MNHITYSFIQKKLDDRPHRSDRQLWNKI